VITQAAGMDRRRHEVMAEGVHLHQRRVAGDIAEVIGIDTLGQARAGTRLGRHQAHLLARRFIGEEGEGGAGEVGAAAAAGEHHVGIVTDLLELLLGFQADHRLVQADVVEHGAEAVIGVLARGRFFHRFGDGKAKRTGIVRIRRQRGATRVGHVGGRSEDFRSPGLHHRAAEGLLVVAHLHHVDAHFDAEHLARQGHRGAPLAGTRLGGQAGDADHLVEEGLRHGGVDLVRTGRADAFVFVVDLRRRAEHLLETAGAEHRRRAPLLVDLAHLFGNRDPALTGHFLLEQRSREDGQHLLGRDRIAVRRQRRQGRLRHVRDDVVPVGRNIGFVEQNLDVRHLFPPRFMDSFQARLQCLPAA